MEPASSQISAQICWLNDEKVTEIILVNECHTYCFGKSDCPVNGTWLYKSI